MADEKDEFIRDIEEDLKRERAIRLWKRYGHYVVALAVLIVAGTAAWVGWREYDRGQAAAEAVRYLDAVGRATVPSERDAALAAFSRMARDGRAGFAPLAALQSAALQAGSDSAGAIAQYRALANDSRASPDIQALARLLAALHAVESADGAQIDRDLQPLMAADSPWRHLASEIAAIAALRGGNTTRARELYARISDDSAAPAGIRARAAEMIQALGG
jgi:hypothetical protein